LGKKLIEASDITVVYPNGVRANDGVNIEIYEGEVLALLGENGAGKSTLAKVLSGTLRPLRGRIAVDGEEVVLKSYREALKRGIYYAPQNPQLVPGITVLEDIGLAMALAGKQVGRGILRKAVEGYASKYGLEIRIDVACDDLSVGERQRVEVLKALLLGSRVVILDEPTTHLTPLEASRLLSTLRILAEEGRGAILITHKVREALSVADRIAVMRRGRIVGVVSAEGLSREVLLEMMFGPSSQEALGYRVDKGTGSRGDPVLEIRGLWVRGGPGGFAVRGASLRVHRGEVVGIAGIAGNGQRELFEAIVGLRKPEKGQVIIRGVDATRLTTLERLRLGMAVVPEERLGWALVPGLSILANIAFALANVDPRLGRWIMSWGAARRAAREALGIVPITTEDLEAEVDSLSGGNMQRLILARELYRMPHLILAMGPTSGLDYATSAAVKRIFAEYAEKGVGVLMISEDLEELVEVSDRVAVMSRGSIVGEFSRPFSVEDIASAMVA